MRFLISASGTGGHVFPANEFSKECIQNNHEIIWIGTKIGIENKIINEDILFLTLPMRGFRGKNLLYKILSLLSLISSVFKSIYYLKKNNIDYVICFGGYISLPVGLSAWICRKPLFLHEQNAVMGTSNTLLKKFSKIIFLGFSLNKPLIKKMKLVGNPIKKFKENAPLDLNRQPIRIYVTGGSQGSEFLNSTIPIALNSLDIEIEVRHQSGVGKASGIEELYSNKISVEVVEFYDNPQDSILWSDFMISRAGALSLSEAISLKRGSIMIPLSSSIDDHQLFNALNIKNLGMGLIHEESESIESLTKKIKNIIDKKLYIKWSKKKNNFDHFQSAERMLISILRS